MKLSPTLAKAKAGAETIGLPNRYNQVLHFPFFILIYYVSNLVKKRLSYEALKIA